MEEAIRPQHGRVGAVNPPVWPQGGRAQLSERLDAAPGAAQRPRGHGARHNRSKLLL